MKHILVLELSEFKDQELGFFWGFFRGQSSTINHEVIGKLFSDVTESLEREMLNRKLVTRDQLDMMIIDHRAQMLGHKLKMKKLSENMIDEVNDMIDSPNPNES